jgi:hypothetical protein
MKVIEDFNILSNIVHQPGSAIICTIIGRTPGEPDQKCEYTEVFAGTIDEYNEDEFVSWVTLDDLEQLDGPPACEQLVLVDIQYQQEFGNPDAEKISTLWDTWHGISEHCPEDQKQSVEWVTSRLSDLPINIKML